MDAKTSEGKMAEGGLARHARDVLAGQGRRSLVSQCLCSRSRLAFGGVMCSVSSDSKFINTRHASCTLRCCLRVLYALRALVPPLGAADHPFVTMNEREYNVNNDPVLALKIVTQFSAMSSKT